MEELKPCPFCGSRDLICEDAGATSDRWFIQCNSCYVKYSHFYTKQETITAWNTRAERGDTE